MGLMGAGKSAIGKALADRLGVPFLDSDAEIETASNLSIAEVFETYGEDFFREKEAQVLARLVREETGILSTGGGAFLRAENQASIAAHGIAVWLRADLALLWSRVKHKDTRPLLRTPDPKATLAALCQAREPEYAKAEVVVDARPEYSIEDTTTLVVNTLLERADVLEKVT